MYVPVNNMALVYLVTNCLLPSKWLLAFGLSESDVSDYHRVCTQHFLNGDCTQLSLLHFGKQFRLPKKSGQPDSKEQQRERCKHHLQYSKNQTTTLTSSDMMHMNYLVNVVKSEHWTVMLMNPPLM